jgi:hypothetical protein
LCAGKSGKFVGLGGEKGEIRKPGEKENKIKGDGRGVIPFS